MSQLFACNNGNLYDISVPDWHKKPPLRANYRQSHTSIRSTADLKAALRAGPYAWPGGYPLYFIASDGEALSFQAVRENLFQVISAMRNNDNSGWRVVACQINYEDIDLTCAHTGDRIESAYVIEDNAE